MKLGHIILPCCIAPLRGALGAPARLDLAVFARAPLAFASAAALAAVGAFSVFGVVYKRRLGRGFFGFLVGIWGVVQRKNG